MSDIDQQAPPRDQWGTKLGFILAAMGSAIGLGNIWRYPYVVYENGGGAFLIPYFIALATAGLPILLLEYSIGHRYRHGAPASFHLISQRWEWLGWWMAAISFVIATYYVVILGWCLSYIWYSFGEDWGEDTATFFIAEYLGTSEGADPAGFWDIGSPQWKVLFAVLIAWAIVYYLMQRGVSRGIEMASRILMPTLIVLLIIIVIRALTLEGAADGLNVLFTPDFSALGDFAVWSAAYGQVFFSLSVAFSIMIAYSSYLPRRTDLSNSGLIVGLSNAGFEFMAAIGVFAALGFLAITLDTEVTEVAGGGGVGLAFIVFPQIISSLPAFQPVFGVIFFASLLFAGITSMVSILECVVAAIREKFDLGRVAAVNWICGVAFVISILYVTKGGLFYLDTVDHFVNAYGLVVAGLAEVLLIAWIARTLDEQRDHLNDISYIKMGPWWTVSMKFITPVLLTLVVINSLVDEFGENYSGYPTSGLLFIGAGGVLLTLLASLTLSLNSRVPHQFDLTKG
ncbi:MAG TPA: sodium-dependent transporter [Nocardioidaceae bacterium]|nr:sodium-dependent transporter [Nocardioidaceae bacterium]